MTKQALLEEQSILVKEELKYSAQDLRAMCGNMSFKFYLQDPVKFKTSYFSLTACLVLLQSG